MSANIPFIGRQTELRELEQLQQSDIANLVVLQGRRRIGKSRLVAEFAKNKIFYSFAGLAPTEGMTAQMQRDEFSRQLQEQLKLPPFMMQDWGDLFTLLATYVQKKQVVILLDEISWMGSEDPTFLGKLKNAWDLQFKNNAKLMLVLCGSVSSWIEKNIISNTLFFGRPSLYMLLKELSLKECNQFWNGFADRTASFEKLKILSVTGGIPWYLELIDPKNTAENNIKKLCFSANSPLLDEFERIFSDIFGKRSSIYKKIIARLATGQATQEEILASCQRSKTGDFSEYLHDLEMAGFVTRDFTWNIKSGKISKLSQYRLKDNYLHFYLKYIQKNKQKIKKGFYDKFSIAQLPGWEGIAGLQFQNLVLNNELSIFSHLNISVDEIIFSNPFFQKKNKNQQGCQIDLLIQTKFNCVYVCEIKFSKSVLTSTVIDEIQEKIIRLQLPKNFSYRPVLIHVNGVNDAIIDSGYFSHIINFGELLN